MTEPFPTLADALWSKVARKGPDDCWLWTGAILRKGYGGLSYRNKKYRVHRASWEVHHGPILGDLMVLHSCDTPACVNPAHLFLGTHQDNMDDMVAKERSPRGLRHGAYTHPERLPRGEANKNSKWTANQILEMRRLHAAGMSQREIARKFGSGRNWVRQIVNGKAWRHLAAPQTSGEKE